MINTFQNSFNPPPVPPRPGHRGPMLPANTPLVKFLSVMMLLLMILTFGGFLYMFHILSQNGYSDTNLLKQVQECTKNKPDNLTPGQREYCKKLMENTGMGQDGRVSFLTGGRFSNLPVAQLVLEFPLGNSKILRKRQIMENQLYWDQKHSLMKKISVNNEGVITIEQPGYYFLYSQVTFSKGHSKIPLMQVLWTLKPQIDGKTETVWEPLLKSYCSLSENSLVPSLCTASLAGVYELQMDQRLCVNVTSWDLVNEDSSTFGLFKLHD